MFYKKNVVLAINSMRDQGSPVSTARRESACELFVLAHLVWLSILAACGERAREVFVLVVAAE